MPPAMMFRAHGDGGEYARLGVAVSSLSRRFTDYFVDDENFGADCSVIAADRACQSTPPRVFADELPPFAHFPFQAV